MSSSVHVDNNGKYILILGKFNFHEIFFIITLTTAYFFDFVFNSVPNIIVFFINPLFSSVESKIKYLFPFFPQYIRFHD